MKLSFYAFTFEELQSIFEENELNPSAATILYNWHYKKKLITHDYPKVAQETHTFITENFDFTLPKIETVHESKDGTVKFLFKLQDGLTVETVLIPFHHKYSICISSQVGCAMNCSFCFTGTEGLKRNLETSEMVGQFLEAWRWLQENREGEPRILNIVFMGQGEPLHNFEAVKQSCKIFLSKHGTSVGAQKITISTAGYIPGLQRWVEEMPGVNLALSLHSTDPEVRDELIPMNKKYPLEEVLTHIDQIPLSKKQFVTYEYLLIAGLNDSKEDARKLGELLQGKSAYINIIPFNEFPGSAYKRPSAEKAESFKEALAPYKIPTLIRIAKGDDVLAACGQLNSKQ